MNSNVAQSVIVGGIYTLRKKIGQGGMASVYYAETDLERFDYTILYAYTQVQADNHSQRRVKAEEFAARLNDKELDLGTVRAILEAHAIPLPDRNVALKVGATRVDLDRFEAEWKNLLCLNHDNVIKVYGGGMHGNRPYYVMELLARIVPVNTLIQKFTVRQKLAVVIDAARGLSYLHENGIVHRDVKPANIITCATDSGRYVTKIADLGIAKSVDDGLELTQENTTMGTPYYMSPEQIKSARDVDHRTDVYSLGATLYELMVMQRPFQAKTSFYDIVAAVQKGERPVSPREGLPRFPEVLSEIILCAMSPSRSRRYQNMSQMIRDLEHYLGEENATVLDACSLIEADTAASSAALGKKQYLCEKLKNKKGGTVPQTRVGTKCQPGTKIAKTSASTRLRSTKLRLDPKKKIAFGVAGAVALIVLLFLGKGFFIPQEQPQVPPPPPSARIEPEQSATAKVNPTADEINAALKKTNADYNGNGRFVVQGGIIVDMNLSDCCVSDIASLKWLQLQKLNLSQNPLSDLSPLRDNSLTSVDIHDTRVENLAALKGMKLEFLDISGTPVSNLSLLAGTELESLRFDLQNIKRGLDSLRELKSLKHIQDGDGERLTAEVFWKKYDEAKAALAAQKAPRPEPPAGKPITVQEINATLKAANPDYNGGCKFDLVGGNIVGAHAVKCGIGDVAPFALLAKLKRLTICGNPLSDLSPLKDMELVALNLHDTKVMALDSLAGMPLEELQISATGVSDLSALKGMPLTHLYLFDTTAADLSPLAGMPLEEIILTDSAVADLTPLKDAKLRNIRFTPGTVKQGVDRLREMESLKSINGMSAEKFWQTRNDN
jgi:serine/threonine protein kinase